MVAIQNDVRVAAPEVGAEREHVSALRRLVAVVLPRDDVTSSGRKPTRHKEERTQDTGMPPLRDGRSVRHWVFARLCCLRRCVSGAKGHCACSDSTDLGRLAVQATPSLRESVNSRALSTLPTNHG